MQENFITPLLHRQLTNELDETDKRILLDWLANSEKNEQLKEEITELWELSKNYQPKFQPNVDEAFAKFKERIEKGEQESDAQISGEQNSDKNTSFSSWRFFVIPLFLIFGSFIVWSVARSLPGKEVVVTTLEGDIKHIKLKDGSEIWLNEKSKITYNKKILGSNRDISLEGEAFFNITEDNRDDFIIRYLDTEVIANGDVFSINTNIDSGKVAVDVKEGIVKLAPLGSGRQLVLTNNELGYYDPVEMKLLPKVLLEKSNADYFVKL